MPHITIRWDCKTINAWPVGYITDQDLSYEMQHQARLTISRTFFTASNGIRLASVMHPERPNERNIVYVRGNDPVYDNNPIIPYDIRDFLAINEAIHEFNVLYNTTNQGE